MAQYRKKPVVIEAISFLELTQLALKHWDKTRPDINEEWTYDYNGHKLIATKGDNAGFLIPTLEGDMKFVYGDMLITGVNGEIYPCKMDIFEKTYDLVTTKIL